MSSDYIPRLRSELLRAGASRQARWRPARAVRPLAVAAAVAAIAVAIVIALPLGSDERAVEPATHTVAVTYGVAPALAERTADVLRARLAGAGIDGARVSVAGASLTITAPAAARADVAVLAQPGRLGFYDWERSVIGPRGVPAPADASVTGDPGAGQSAALTKAAAEARASGVPGARAVSAPGHRWFVLAGDPALTNADIASPRSAVDPSTHEPIVTIDLTPHGQAAFTELTRELSRRGADRATPGAHLEAMQHLAIVMDDRILAVPFIDYQRTPDGIDGARGAQISGDLTPQTARDVASVLDTGPLPAALR